MPLMWCREMGGLRFEVPKYASRDSFVCGLRFAQGHAGESIRLAPGDIFEVALWPALLIT